MLALLYYQEVKSIISCYLYYLLSGSKRALVHMLALLYYQDVKERHFLITLLYRQEVRKR